MDKLAALREVMEKVQRAKGWSYSTVSRRMNGLLPVIENVDSLDADVLLSGLWERYKKGIISASTLNREASTVVEIGKFQGKAIAFKRLKEDSRAIEALSRKQIETLLNLLSGQHQLLTKLLFFSGARIGEALKLRGRDLMKDENGYYINIRNTKTRMDRMVPVPKEIWAELKEVSFGREGNVFSTNYDAYRIALLRAGKKMGVHIHPHMIRHTYATQMVKANISVFTIKDLLGHQDVKVTERYVHADMSDRIKAVAHVFGE